MNTEKSRTYSSIEQKSDHILLKRGIVNQKSTLAKCNVNKSADGKENQCASKIQIGSQPPTLTLPPTNVSVVTPFSAENQSFKKHCQECLRLRILLNKAEGEIQSLKDRNAIKSKQLKSLKKELEKIEKSEKLKQQEVIITNIYFKLLNFLF